MPTQPHVTTKRQGLSLLELIAVVTLIGIFASVVSMRFGRSLSAEFRSQGIARELALALVMCQRASITSGDDHYVELLSGSGKINNYRIMRIVSGTPTLIDGPKAISEDVTVTASNTTLQFNFEGGALSNYWINVQGQDRVWRIDVVPVSGAVNLTQTN